MADIRILRFWQLGRSILIKVLWNTAIFEHFRTFLSEIVILSDLRTILWLHFSLNLFQFHCSFFSSQLLRFCFNDRKVYNSTRNNFIKASAFWKIFSFCDKNKTLYAKGLTTKDLFVPWFQLSPSQSFRGPIQRSSWQTHKTCKSCWNSSFLPMIQ
jgi:hypothetical protein